MLRILRSPPTCGSVAVEFRLDDRADLIGADRGGHESFGELFGQIRESLGILLSHGGLHLSAADGGTTMPELARWVQVRDVVRGSAPSGLRSGPQVPWSGAPAGSQFLAVGWWGPAEPARDGQVGDRAFPQTRGAPNQGHSRTPVFRETAGRSRVVRVFHAAVPRRDSPNSFHRRKSPAIEQGILPSLGCQAARPRLSVSRRTRGTGNMHVTSCVFCPSLVRCACPPQRQTTFPARAHHSSD